MEPEGSLPQSQMPAICPYPEPARTSPYSHIPLPEDPSYFYPPIYARVSQVVSYPSGFPTKSLYTPLLSPKRATCPAYLIILDFIIRISVHTHIYSNSNLADLPPRPSALGKEGPETLTNCTRPQRGPRG